MKTKEKEKSQGESNLTRLDNLGSLLGWPFLWRGGSSSCTSSAVVHKILIVGRIVRLSAIHISTILKIPLAHLEWDFDDLGCIADNPYGLHAWSRKSATALNVDMRIFQSRSRG